MAINMFERLISRAENEVLFLQTYSKKTSAQIPLTTKSVSISIPLKLWGTQDPHIVDFAAGEKMAVITVNSADTPNILVNFYLGSDTTSLNNRSIVIGSMASADGKPQCVVRVEGNNSDAQALAGGGSVSVPLTIEAIGTSVFTLAVEYRNDKWSDA